MAAFDSQRLGDFFRVKHGYAFKGEFFSDSGAFILLTPGNFEARGGLKLKGDKEKYYIGEIPDDFVLRQGDLVVAMTDLTQNAPILGAPAIIPTDGRFLHNQRLGKLVDVNTDRLNIRYLFYLFNLPEVRSQIKSTATGATVRHTAPDRIYEVRAPLPAPKMQRRIADVLSAYDDLIENNTKRIKILEEMARSLYREWFVEFRFPGRGRIPLVESSLGALPRGWDVIPLEELKANVRYAMNGGPFGSKLGVKDYVTEGVPVIRGSNLTESGRFLSDDFVFVAPAKAVELTPNLARPGDIVLTQRGTLGQIGKIPTGGSYDAFVISQSQMKFTPDQEKVDPEYILFALSGHESNRRFKSLASSSGVPHINLAALREFLVVVPPLSLQRRFGELARASEAGIEGLIRQTSILRKTREFLLPRLLSGEIELHP